ncbi:hypothetical protein R5R35_012047 [Gryllus longicercus]|uniref:separase n=1 Tax=Gryllus longicercus TaxID=2509291 RepID=A0AAN9VEW6_9ORTH
MASADGSDLNSALKQLLANPRAFGSIDDRRAYLREALRVARCSPPGYTYCSLCRQLADLSFQVGDKEDGIYNLVESHAVVLRHRALIKYHRTMGKSPNNSSVIDKKYVDFSGEMSDGYNSLLNRLKEMPEEWTIIQLSCVVDAVWRFGGPNAKKWTPHLDIVRMECGPSPEFKPLHIRLAPPPEAKHYVVLREVQEMIIKNNTDHLRDKKKDFWQARAEVDVMIEFIIEFMNSKWFASINPFLAGRLNDEKVQKKLRARVEGVALKISTECGTAPLSPEKLCLLLKAAENFDYLSDGVLAAVLARVVDELKSPSALAVLKREFGQLKKEFPIILKNIKRGPVLLIIDEKLECLPIEQLEILRKHPATRVPSVHVTHGLYSVHRNSIENGLLNVDYQSGFYIINPGEDLKDMEERMSSFLLPRVPKWKGLLGQQLSPEAWSQAVTDNDIFVYMGHGGGGQYWNVDQLEGGIRSLSLLFGCQSAGYKIMKGSVEVDGTLQAYLAAACPCLVGLLWNVTDRDTDLLAQAILNQCLPQSKNPPPPPANERKGRRKGRGGAGAGAEGPSTPGALAAPREPEVARALTLAREAPRMLVTRVAAVLRGLPARVRFPRRSLSPGTAPS